jgi:hypothetical protein
VVLRGTITAQEPLRLRAFVCLQRHKVGFRAIVVLRGTKMAYEPYCDGGGELTLAVAEQLDQGKERRTGGPSAAFVRTSVVLQYRRMTPPAYLPPPFACLRPRFVFSCPNCFAKTRLVMGLSWL